MKGTEPKNNPYLEGVRRSRALRVEGSRVKLITLARDPSLRVKKGFGQEYALEKDAEVKIAPTIIGSNRAGSRAAGVESDKGQLMPDQPPASPTTTTPPAPAAATPPAAPAGPTINIGEEYGTAKKNLPPAKIVLIAVGAVLVVVLIASFLKRAKPQGSGSLDNVVAVEIPGQNATMVALTFTLHNGSDKALYIREIQSSLKAPSGDATADAVSAVDFDRYFQAFPDLKTGSQPALSPEVRLEPGETVNRTVIVAYQKTLNEFNQRKGVSVIIWPYNYTVPIILTK
ncbi:MAG: hypothetical protein WA485_05020 [Candidatus Sulfotelmatobacter sp.]